MDTSWLTLRDLQYIEALAVHLHFRKASEACFVSQPALSAQIKKIEGLLGLMIFERSHHKVALTAMGEILVKQARIILEEARKIGEISQGQQAPMSSNLHLGSIASLGPYLIPHLLSPLRKTFPQAKFLFKEGLTQGLLHDLKAGELDMVLAADTFEDAELRKIPIFHEPFWLAMPKDNPLAKQDFIRVKDIHSEEMVLLEDGHCLKDQALEFCSLSKGKNLQTFQATGLETLRHLVASGMGYTFFPYLAVKNDVKLNPLLKYTPFADEKVGRTIVLVCRKHYAKMSEADLLAQFIREHLPAGVHEMLEKKVKPK